MAVAGYEIRVDGGSPVDVGNVLTHTVDSLTADTEYDFEVRAYDGAGNYSAWSDVVSETTEEAPLVGLIDVIGSTAAAAYGLRKLRGAYSGAGVRVRRASDNAEQDIGFSGEALDWAAAISFKGASTIFVKTWYDQSGNGINLVQATSGSQPQLDTSGEEIDFDGSDDFLASASTLDLSGTDQATTYCAAKNNEIYNHRVYFEHSADAETVNGFGFHGFSYNVYAENGVGSEWNQRYYPHNQSIYQLHSSRIDRSLTTTDQTEGWLDGGVMAYYNGTGGNGYPDDLSGNNFDDETLYVGAKAGSSEFLTGGMKELVIFAEALADTPRDDGEDNINTFYSIF